MGTSEFVVQSHAHFFELFFLIGMILEKVFLLLKTYFPLGSIGIGSHAVYEKGIGSSATGFP